MEVERATGMGKVHALIYSLLFPGFLAAFMLSQVTEEALIAGFAPWGWLLSLYFAVQFVEGHESKTHYRWQRAAVNLFEIFVMVLIFAALGYFPGLKVGGFLRSPGTISLLMAIVFALPAIYRLASGALSEHREGYLFARSLFVMSTIAAVLSGLFAGTDWAWVVVLILLLTYMFAFQFCNDWFVDQLPTEWHAFRRP